MIPESDRFLQKAEKHLERGHTMLGVGLDEDAGRAAYLAAFHAAQALIFERTSKVHKTHKGVQTEFLRLTKDDPGFPSDQRIFLSQAYNLKTIADYEIGAVPKFRRKRPPPPSKEHAGLLVLSARL